MKNLEEIMYDEKVLENDTLFELFCNVEVHLKEKDEFLLEEDYFSLLQLCINEEYIEYMHIINDCMHIIHTIFPNIRKNSLKESDVQRHIIFNDYNDCLLGEFPDELKQEIQGLISKDDVALKFKTTWIHSHLSEGSAYRYTNNEQAELIMFALNDEIADHYANIIKERYNVYITDY